MKRVLIMVVSSQEYPYPKMAETQKHTWDSVKVDGVETVFYWGQPVKENTDTDIYFNYREGYDTMGYKTLDAYQWALGNKEFDYLARVNSSTYVDKKELIKYVQTLTDKEVFAGLQVTASETVPTWMWGFSYILSKDVVEMVVDYRELWEHDKIDDMAISHLINRFGFEYTKGKGCSIDRMEDKWRCLCYGTESFEFKELEDFKKAEGQFFYRIKQDYDRNMDETVMNQIHKTLTQ